MTKEMVWTPAGETPPREARFIVALRASKSRAPRIDFAWWTKQFGWANKYVTHWMELPENPND